MFLNSIERESNRRLNRAMGVVGDGQFFFDNDPEKPQFSLVQLQQLQLPELQTAIDKFIGQKGSFKGMTDTIKESSSQKMSALDELFPGYKAGLTKTQQVADQESQGMLPTDVASAISRSSAFKGLSSGLAGGSGARSSVEARDMGMTSYDMVNRGLARQQNLRGEANAMMPLQAMNLAFTPQGIRQEDVSVAQYNNNIANQQAMTNNQIKNRQAESDYAYNQQYGGEQWVGAVTSAVGAAAGAYFGGPMGMSMGASLGGALGGIAGGSQSNPGGIMGMGMGSMGMGLAGQQSNPYSWGGNSSVMGASGYGGNGSGGFSSLPSMQAAAPYAGGYTSTPDGFVPRAQLFNPRA